MTLDEKITHAVAVVREAAAARAVCLLSFGKDSTVVMDMARREGIRRCLTVANPDEQQDANFIASLVEAWQLDVRVVGPGRGTFAVVNDRPIFMAMTPLSGEKAAAVPMTFPTWEENDPRILVCVDDALRAHRSTLPPDDVPCVLSGFKRADLQNGQCGNITNVFTPQQRADYEARVFSSPTAQVADGLTAYFPLLDWTDADVWEYIDRFRVPVSAVYGEDKRKRPPTRAWCYRCHDPRLPRTVHCPKRAAPIQNLAAVTQDSDLRVETWRRLGMLFPDHAAELQASTAGAKPAKIADVQVYRPQIEDFKLAKLWHAMVTSGDITAFPPSYCVLLSFMQMMQPPTTLVYEEDDDGIWLAVWIEPSTWDFSTAGLWLREDKRKSPGAYEAIRLAFHHFFTKTNAVIAYTLTEARAREYMKFGFEYRGIMPGVALGGDLHQLVLTRDRFESIQAPATGEA